MTVSRDCRPRLSRTREGASTFACGGVFHPLALALRQFGEMACRFARARVVVSENPPLVRQQPLQLRGGLGVFALFCEGRREVGDARHGGRVALAVGRRQHAEQLAVRTLSSGKEALLQQRQRVVLVDLHGGWVSGAMDPRHLAEDHPEKTVRFQKPRSIRECQRKMALENERLGVVSRGRRQPEHLLRVGPSSRGFHVGRFDEATESSAGRRLCEQPTSQLARLWNVVGQSAPLCAQKPISPRSPHTGGDQKLERVPSKPTELDDGFATLNLAWKVYLQKRQH